MNTAATNSTVPRFKSPSDFLKFMEVQGTNLGFNMLWSLIFLIIGLILVKIIIWILKRVLKHRKLNETAIYFTLSGLNVMLKLFVIMISIDMLGIEMISMATILAAVAFAIGLSLSGLLQNFVSGLYLVASDPINIGDYVEVVGGIEGTVLHIGTVTTVIRTPDRRQVIIPNSNLATNNIINYNKEANRRCDREIILPFNEDLEYAKKVLLQACRKSPLVLKEPEPYAVVKDLRTSDHGIVVSIRAYVTREQYWDLWFILPELIKTEMEKYGLNLQIPQQAVYMTDHPYVLQKPEHPIFENNTPQEHQTTVNNLDLDDKSWKRFFSRRHRQPKGLKQIPPVSETITEPTELGNTELKPLLQRRNSDPVKIEKELDRDLEKGLS